MKRIVFILFICIFFITIPGGAETLITGGPYISGDMVNIRGETNFNTDNQLLVEIYPASFGPTQKYEPSMTGGASAVVPVLQTGENKFSWSANISSTGWRPDQYMVRVEMIGKDYRESALFTLTEINPGEGNKTGSVNLTAESGSKSNESHTMEQPGIDQIDQELKNESTSALIAPTLTETAKPDQTQKNPLSTELILISIIIGVFVIIYKKE